MKRIVVVGAGGFGREVVQIISSVNAVSPTWALIGIVDDSPQVCAPTNSVPWLGPVAMLTELADHDAVIAVGSPRARARIAGAYPEQRWATVVHPDATIATDTMLGPGCVIAPGARISVNCVLGAHVHVDQNVTIGHDTTVGAFARLNPQACVSGSVAVGDEVLVGASATILQGLTVGAGSTVGAGAVVVRDVPEGVVVKGVPAR